MTNKQNTAKILRDRSLKTIMIKTPEGDEVPFILRGISGKLVVDNYRLFSTVQGEKIDMDSDNLSEEDIKYIEEKVAPLLNKILPVCLVMPAIANGPDDSRLLGDNPTAIEFDDLPPQMMLELFNQIFKVAGMSKEAIEAQKNLPSQIGPKP